MRTYLIPGLGFDHRIFQKLRLKSIGFDYLNWIDPLENESFKDYARRLSARIDGNEKNITLIGHSLGGMIAQEIAALRPVAKIILISSVKSRGEIPLITRIVKPLGIYRLFTKELTTKTLKYWGKGHGYESVEEQELVVDMVQKQSNRYLQWALRQLSIWDKPNTPSGTKLFHIHGALDKTFPIALIDKPDKTIENAGHFMVYKQADLINEILEEELSFGT